MTISGFRIALWTMALAVAVMAGWHWHRKDLPAPAAEQAAWIPIPATGMDASAYSVRKLLADNFEHGAQRAHALDGALPLAERCGAGLPNEPAETYAAVIGDHWFAPDRKMWSIEMTSSGDWLDVVIKDADAPPAPPEPASGLSASPRQEVRLASRHVVRKAELADVRAAWIKPELWLAPQSSTNCLDGHTVYLEACVLGRYHARSRNCEPAGAEAGMALWRRLRAHFPDPPPMELR